MGYIYVIPKHLLVLTLENIKYMNCISINNLLASVIKKYFNAEKKY